jgi:hypothetical protein
LFVQTFGSIHRTVTRSMCDYFADVYLDSPWAEPESTSVVATDDGGRLVGFLGVMPMPVRLERTTMRAAIGSAFMVDPAHTDPLTAVRLLRTVFGGQQDLTLTDTANDAAITFWTKLGGNAARFSSMRWLLPLRPAGAALAMTLREERPRTQRLVAPVARTVDWMLGRFVAPPPSGIGTLREAVASDVYRFLTDLDDRAMLGFGGTAAEFEWLVDMLRRKRRFGPVQLLTLHVRGSAARGAVIYYPNRGRIGQLAFAAAAHGEHPALLGALRRHAYEAESAAIMGKADARLSTELRGLPCAYLYRNDFTMLHSRHPGLTTKLCTGDVAMSHLTGEWWTRFQGDRFE